MGGHRTTTTTTTTTGGCGFRFLGSAGKHAGKNSVPPRFFLLWWWSCLMLMLILTRLPIVLDVVVVGADPRQLHIPHFAICSAIFRSASICIASSLLMAAFV
jgi:hypothetical protein